MTTIKKHKPRVLLTRHLPDDVEARAADIFDVQLNTADRVLTADELLFQAASFDALLVTSFERYDGALIARLPDPIKMIATFSVGYEHIDIAACRAKGITVSNTPDVLTDATADTAILLMLGAARGASWGDRMVREDRWGPTAPTWPLGYDVSGQRLGILGMGRIGQAVAKRAQAFGMELHYHNRSRVDPAREHGARFHARFEDMLPHCDFLSINCASTPETRGSINSERIALLPKGAILVNSARGNIVNDDALIAALQSGHLAAAGLDVFNNEPNIDPRYRTLDNVFLLPHLGSATRRTRSAMGMRAVDNLEAFFAGQRPRDQLT
jgi:glyoxylate reductase